MVRQERRGFYTGDREPNQEYSVGFAVREKASRLAGSHIIRMLGSICKIVDLDGSKLALFGLSPEIIL